MNDRGEMTTGSPADSHRHFSPGTELRSNSATVAGMNSGQLLVSARIVGHVMWWVFVVSALFAGGITWWSPYESLGAPFGGWAIGSGSGFIAFSPGPQWWQDPAVYAPVAFVLVVVAAVVDAVAARGLIAGIVTVAVPFIALGFFVLATPGGIDGVFLHSAVSLVLVLVGVAIREVWMRAGAPRVIAWQQA